MARNFGAGREYIEIAPNAVFNDTIFSIAFRWRLPSSGQWSLISKHQASTSQNGWGFSSNNGSPNRLQFAAKPNSGGGWTVVDGSVNAADGAWHSAVGRCNRSASGTLDIMVDGTSATQVAIGAFDHTAQVLRIGSSIDGFWADVIGDIEDFAYWSARLTGDECRAFCQGAEPGSIRPADLKVWLPLRD